jgi:F-type H+-transporting ATPase subunit delta
MNEGKIAVRYAKALFLIAEEKNLLEQVKLDMLLISEVIKTNPSFKDFLYSPISKPSDRSGLINIAFGEDRIQKITLNFLEILIEHNRIEFLEGATRLFFTIYRKNKGIKSATLVTAGELSLDYQQKFQTILKKIYKAEIELTIHSDPDIIGGFVLTVEDQQYDASIAHKLHQIKTSLVAENLK